MRLYLTGKSNKKVLSHLIAALLTPLFNLYDLVALGWMENSSEASTIQVILSVWSMRSMVGFWSSKGLILSQKSES